MAPRLLIASSLCIATACAQVTGVEGYSVSEAPNAPSRQEVAGFLGGGACAQCVLQACSAELDACQSDRSACAEPAACMQRCSQTPWGGTDPACVFTKCGAALAPKEGLNALSVCSRRACADACEVGRSYGCAGRYDWPPPPSNGFDLVFSLDVWQDTWDPSPHLVGATVGFCNDTGSGGGVLGAPTVLCPDSPLGQPSVTDATGSVRLHVPPFPGVGVASTPPFHVYIGATNSSPTQQYPTLPARYSWNGPLRPWAGAFSTITLAHGHAPNGNIRFLCGFVLDCHGSRVLAAEGLAVTTNIPYPASIIGYWHADETFQFDATDSTGNFCVFIGDTDNPTPDPSGVFAVTFTDTNTQETRLQLDVAIPSEGHVGLLVFPRSASQQ